MKANISKEYCKIKLLCFSIKKDYILSVFLIYKKYKKIILLIQLYI